MPAKRRDFEKAALKKGFREIRKGTHVFYRYTDSKGEVYDRVHTMVIQGIVTYQTLLSQRCRSSYFLIRRKILKNS